MHKEVKRLKTLSIADFKKTIELMVRLERIFDECQPVTPNAEATIRRELAGYRAAIIDFMFRRPREFSETLADEDLFHSIGYAMPAQGLPKLKLNLQGVPFAPYSGKRELKSSLKARHVELWVDGPIEGLRCRNGFALGGLCSNGPLELRAVEFGKGYIGRMVAESLTVHRSCLFPLWGALTTHVVQANQIRIGDSVTKGRKEASRLLNISGWRVTKMKAENLELGENVTYVRNQDGGKIAPALPASIEVDDFAGAAVPISVDHWELNDGAAATVRKETAVVVLVGEPLIWGDGQRALPVAEWCKRQCEGLPPLTQRWLAAKLSDPKPDPELLRYMNIVSTLVAAKQAAEAAAKAGAIHGAHLNYHDFERCIDSLPLDLSRVPLQKLADYANALRRPIAKPQPPRSSRPHGGSSRKPYDHLVPGA